ncbi:P2Y purinoceptor 4-like [Rissa tridactyla]|uniref:P2Y purinoceptor 4-like n=1 Tax=Rissa tridactyla TaxID=75485 RepID=UPI0023BAB8E9|nr:P2Y purinoceptor 4-like [Rissa tridactyla]
MDPRILIFLLYVMILHELVSGWMEYQKQIAKPKKQAGPVWSSSNATRSSHSSFSRPLVHSVRRERYRDWRKPGRIIRKANQFPKAKLSMAVMPSNAVEVSSGLKQVSTEGSPESLDLLASLTSMNTSVDCVPQELHPTIPALGTLLLLGCVLLNGMSFWVFCFRIKQWDSGMILQVSLVLGDVLIIPVAPLRISYLSLGNQWPFGQFLCKLEFFLDSIHIYSSIYFLTLICIHRYFVVVRYKSKSLWKKKSFLRKLCLFVWLVLIVQGLPFFFVLKTSAIDGSAKCLNIHQLELSSIYYFYNIVVVVLSFLLPFAVSLACGALLGAAIAKVAKKSSRGKKMKSRPLQMITVSLVIFAVCFGPLHICRTIGVTVKYYGMPCKLLHQVEVAYYISWVFTMANTCLDPLIYVFANEKFKRSFADSFRKRWGTKVTMKGPVATTDLPRKTYNYREKL